MKSFKRRKALLLSSALAGALALGANSAIAQSTPVYQFDIPAESLSKALKDFSLASAQQIVFSDQDIGDRKAPALHGSYTRDQALAILLGGADLRVETSSSGVLMVRPKNVQAASDDGAAIAPDVETVIVTGSRIPTQIGNSAQDIRVYNSTAIRESGQVSVSDFLSTVPSVSLASSENSFQTSGNTTVNLHGLPSGTTLVLLNGRRVETSGIQAANDFFDLNNIPLSAVDRIEIVDDGSSAIYGSDAIGGVVNIILKQNFDGLDASVRYGSADNLNETDANVAWGYTGTKWSMSVIGSYETNGSLSFGDRKLTASNDYTRFGGSNNNYPYCAAANVFSLDGSALPGSPVGSAASFAAISRTAGSTPTLSDFQYGNLNQCAFETGSSVLPSDNRYGIFAQANYQLTDSVELFAELLGSSSSQRFVGAREGFFGEVGYQQYTMSGANPFNPFGETVGVSVSFPQITGNYAVSTQFLRPVIGVRGTIFGDWSWELAAYEAADWSSNSQANQIIDTVGIQDALNSPNAATAIDPFSPSGTSEQVLQSFYGDAKYKFASRDESVEGFVRGPAFTLPAGPLTVVFGGEYVRSALSTDVVQSGPGLLETNANYGRTSYAVFGEGRVPILAGADSDSGHELLAATLAGRYDHYSDFGDKPTYQLGAEFRPFDGLLFRGTLSNAFKAPPLSDLYTPQTTTTNLIIDPKTGMSATVPVTEGGNPSLKPLTGMSHSFGISYRSEFVPGLLFTATNWNVSEGNAIVNLLPQDIVDNEGVLPGRVTRNASGQIIAVDDTRANFGSIRISGIDYQLSYEFPSAVGQWSASATATQTYRYDTTLVPGSPSVNSAGVAQRTELWSPQWKSVLSLGWSNSGYSVNVTGRYTGGYVDYGGGRTIGNFWLFDTNLRASLGDVIGSLPDEFQKTYFEIGAVNLFNTLPQYSQFSPYLGFDPTQGDIRGRFVYARIEIKT